MVPGNLHARPAVAKGKNATSPVLSVKLRLLRLAQTSSTWQPRFPGALKVLQNLALFHRLPPLLISMEEMRRSSTFSGERVPQKGQLNSALPGTCLSS